MSTFLQIPNMTGRTLNILGPHWTVTLPTPPLTPLYTRAPVPQRMMSMSSSLAMNAAAISFKKPTLCPTRKHILARPPVREPSHALNVGRPLTRSTSLYSIAGFTPRTSHLPALNVGSVSSGSLFWPATKRYTGTRNHSPAPSVQNVSPGSRTWWTIKEFTWHRGPMPALSAESALGLSYTSASTNAFTLASSRTRAQSAGNVSQRRRPLLNIEARTRLRNPSAVLNAGSTLRQSPTSFATTKEATQEKNHSPAPSAASDLPRSRGWWSTRGPTPEKSHFRAPNAASALRKCPPWPST